MTEVIDNTVENSGNKIDWHFQNMNKKKTINTYLKVIQVKVWLNTCISQFIIQVLYRE
jgi:hypothetical protein